MQHARHGLALVNAAGKQAHGLERLGVYLALG